MARGDIFLVGLPNSDRREENGLTLPSVAMIFQMRAIDPKRVIRRIGQLETDYLAQIDAEIWKMLKPSSE